MDKWNHVEQIKHMKYHYTSPSVNVGVHQRFLLFNFC